MKESVTGTPPRMDESFRPLGVAVCSSGSGCIKLTTDGTCRSSKTSWPWTPGAPSNLLQSRIRGERNNRSAKNHTREGAPWHTRRNNREGERGEGRGERWKRERDRFVD